MLCSKGKGNFYTYNSQMDTALRYGEVQLIVTLCGVVKGKAKVLHKTASWILRYGTERYNWILRYVVYKGKCNAYTSNIQLDTALRYGVIQLDIILCCVVKGKRKVLHITAS